LEIADLVFRMTASAYVLIVSYRNLHRGAAEKAEFPAPAVKSCRS